MTVMVNGMATRAVYQEQTARALIQGFFGTNDHQGLFTIYSGGGPWGGSWIRKTQWVGTSGGNHGVSPLIQCGGRFNQQKSGHLMSSETGELTDQRCGLFRPKQRVFTWNKHQKDCMGKVAVPTSWTRGNYWHWLENHQKNVSKMCDTTTMEWAFAVGTNWWMVGSSVKLSLLFIKEIWSTAPGLQNATSLRLCFEQAK